MRKKLLTVLSDSGKTSSLIDNVSIVKRYASESSHSIPVSSDDEALMKARKEVFILLFFFLISLYSSYLMLFWNAQVKSDRVQFIWTQFSELYSHFKKQADDDESLNTKIAEMISLLTCSKKPSSRKRSAYKVTSELEDILSRINSRVKSIYSSLPDNAMLVICTGHGDTATVQK